MALPSRMALARARAARYYADPVNREHRQRQMAAYRRAKGQAVMPQRGHTLPFETFCTRQVQRITATLETAADRISTTWDDGEFVLVKWKCPHCGRWVTEDMGRQCRSCKGTQ